ncbi:hypothetical protein PUN28_012193 [Cardiocondyla obscurior]|uniref:Uncharacterized protein n=1 Tax=Cardiocondyla obscurior TaxID=286306 RepID=A0AAW2FDW5_9HYME
MYIWGEGGVRKCVVCAFKLISKRDDIIKDLLHTKYYRTPLHTSRYIQCFLLLLLHLFESCAVNNKSSLIKINNGAYYPAFLSSPNHGAEE